MIVEKIIDLFFLPINSIFALLPESFSIPILSIQIPQPLRYGACFFPMNIINMLLVSAISWYVIFISYAILEWSWKKIPGVS